jgi:hypothetical protein
MPDMTDFSKAKLLDFLDFLGNKGLMNKMTVASRKAAANTLLSILSEQEAQDITKLDLNEVAMRFTNLKGAEFKPESIKVYKSRVSSAIEDFKKYRASPLTFKPSIVSPKAPSAQKADKDSEQNSVVKSGKFVDDPSGVTFPVPIRPNVVVRIVGVPSDLTKREAAKIANVVVALATVDDEPA